MKTFSMLFAALIVGLAGSVAHAADARLKVVKSLPLGGGSARTQVVSPLAATPFYSDIATFSGSVFTFGGVFTGTQTAGTTGQMTAMSCDDLSLDPGSPSGSYTLNEVTFSVSNVNASKVEAAPSLLFYDQATGALIDGVVFNKLSFPGNSVQLLTGDLSTFSPPITFPLDANGEANIWMCQIYDDAGGTAVTAGGLGDLGAGLCDPPTVGSSPDNIYLSNTPILSFAPLPAGGQGNFGGTPVANFCDELAQ